MPDSYTPLRGARALGPPDAIVFKRDRQAGAIHRVDGSTVFSYDAGYLRESDEPVSCRLPLLDEPRVAAAGAVAPYFAGLLPEGARLVALRTRLKVAADDMLSLLLDVGSDCVGDVSVVPTGFAPADIAPAVGADDLVDADFKELFARSITLDRDAADRVAIPGAQEKVSSAVISFPLVTSGVPAILKLSPPRFDKLVENEAFFMAMASECGIRTAQCQLVSDKAGVTGLLVERFDRAIENGAVVRLHQEDACQLLDKYPADKYSISLREVAGAIDSYSTLPTRAVRDFVGLTAFNYLIANGDMHGKNISLSVDPDNEQFELSPAYDLLSTWPYGDTNMALQMDGKDRNLKRREFLAFGVREGVGAKAIISALDRICDVAPTWIGRLGEIELDDKKTSQLAREMRIRREHLARE